MRICIVLLRAYAVFRPEIRKRFGGAEVRIYHLSRALACLDDMEVHVLCRDYGQPDHEVIDGVHLHKFRQGGALGRRIPVYKNLASIPSLYSRLKRIQPDIAIQVCAGIETGIVGHYAQEHHIPAVFMAASDPDADGRFEQNAPGWLRNSYRYGLKRMNAVICQNAYQEEKMAQRLPFAPKRIANPVEVDDQYSQPQGNHILWVGRAIPSKRPEWFLELAKSMPERQFQMIISRGHDSNYSDATLDRARQVSNIDLEIDVPFERMTDYYRAARILVSTSEHEGMPNTFLQAMAHGVPVISTVVDPNEMLSEGGAGRCVEDSPEALRESLEAFLSDEALWSECSRAAWEYVREHHDLKKIARHFQQILQEVRAS
ncbi:MAG: glycosyltransferase family 4 protein [bacterium]